MKEVKNRIAKALEVRDMTAAELSKKSGIGKSSISKYLKGTVIPKQTAIYQMAQALDVSPAWLLGLEVTMDGRHLSLDLDKLSDANREHLFVYYQALLDTQEDK